MEIQKIISSSYGVQENNGTYALIKFIGEYDTRYEAYSDMLKIFSNEKTESEVEKEKRRKSYLGLIPPE